MLKSEGGAMAKDPQYVIRRLTAAVQQLSEDNAALVETIARQKRQLADRDLTIKSLKAQQKASTKQVRAAFATATAYVEAELPKRLEPVLAELRRLQDEEWLREIGEVDPRDAN
jgi:hypothetical protein